MDRGWAGGSRRTGPKCWAGAAHTLYIRLYIRLYRGLYLHTCDGVYLYKYNYTYLQLSARAQQSRGFGKALARSRHAIAPRHHAAITETTIFTAKPIRTRPKSRSIHFPDRAKSLPKPEVDRAIASSTNHAPIVRTTSRP